jgi:predicted ATPase
MIKHIRIQNYKSLGDVSVDLDPVTVLIGRSGTGKSNFVDAIRFLRDYTRIGDAAVQARGGWHLVKPASVDPKVTAFEVRFDVVGNEHDFQYSLSFNWGAQGTANFAEERLACGPNVLLHQRQGKWIRPPDVVPLPPAGPPAIGRISGIPEIILAALVLQNGIGCHHFSGNVMLSTASSAQQWEGLSDSGDNFMQIMATVLGSINSLPKWREMTSTMRTLNQSVKSLTLTMPNRNAITVGHDFNGKGLTLNLAQESDGFRRFLAYLLAMYQTPPKQVLIFDEPEQGIHPGGFEALAEEFKLCPDQGRGQVILTTHSPQLLNSFSASQLRVVEMFDHQTRIGPIAPEQLEALEEHLLYPGELLTVDQARLPGMLTEVPGT